MGGFQTRVNVQNPPAVAGDFASSNPRSVFLAGPGGLVAGLSGVTVGRFGWVASDFKTVNNFSSGPVAPDGFVHREQQALITVYLATASNLVPEGFMVTLHNGGDFWALNNGPDALSTKGATVYAGFADGGVYSSAPSAASVTATLGSTNTASLGSTNTASLGATFTATAGTPDTELVVTAVIGLISIGDILSGTGITPGTTVLSQILGTPGGAGTYGLSAANTCAAATITSFGSVMKTTVTTGLISIGDTVSGGAGFPVGATVTAQVSGTPGGVGVYSLSAGGTAYTASATGVTTFGNVVKVTAASTYISVGDTITGGAGFPAAVTTITAQTSGTGGAAGVYTLSNRGTAYTASATGVLTFGLTLDVTAVGSGSLAAGLPISDSTNPTFLPAGATIAAQINGTTGLTGIYALNASAPATQYSAGDTLVTVGGIDSGWKAYPTSVGDGAVGALVKISKTVS